MLPWYWQCSILVEYYTVTLQQYFALPLALLTIFMPMLSSTEVEKITILQVIFALVIVLDVGTYAILYKDTPHDYCIIRIFQYLMLHLTGIGKVALACVFLFFYDISVLPLQILYYFVLVQSSLSILVVMFALNSPFRVEFMVCRQAMERPGITTDYTYNVLNT